MTDPPRDPARGAAILFCRIPSRIGELGTNKGPTRIKLPAAGGATTATFARAVPVGP
jgi:hypothetical protein